MLWRALSAMALHHGIRISPRDLAAQAAQVPEEMLPEVAVVTMNEYGLKAQIFSTKNLSDIHFYPVLVRIINGEWAIVKKNKNNTVEISVYKKESQNIQSLTMSLIELEKIRDGIIITLEIEKEIEIEDGSIKTGNSKNSNWFSSVFMRLKSYYGDCVVAAIIINLLALAGSMFAMNVYDRVIPNAALNSLWALAVGVLVAGLMEFSIRSIRAYVLDDAGKKADLLLSSSIYKKTLSLGHAQRPQSSGQWASQIREFESVRDFVSSSTLVILTDIPFSILFFAVIFWMGGVIVWIPVIASFLIIIAGAITQIPIRKSVQRYQYENTQKHAMLIESIERLETIEALGAKPVFQGKWERLTASASKSAMASRMASAFTTNISQYLQQTAYTSMIVGGVYLILQGQLTVGALIGCSILLSRALTPLGQIAGLISRWHNTKMSFDVINKLMQLEVRSDAINKYISINSLDKKIELMELEYKFPRTEKNVINIKNTVFKRGEIIAVMGPVGSGKSTLLRLIAGLYIPTTGRLLIDGLEINQISPADWRSQVAWVSQDAILFRGSLRENLLIAAPIVSDERIIHIIKLCGLESMIVGNPQGLDMQIGEAGQQLSGGQKQMLCLARALLSDVPVILLDEPTSSLDMNTEKELLKRLKIEFINKIVLIATHRPGPLEISERLIILDDGRIAADGLKDEVLQDVREGRIKRTHTNRQEREEVTV